MNRIGKELFPLYLEVRRADVLAQSEYLRREKLDDISKVEAIYKEILSLNQCTSVKELAVNGRDLITEGIRRDGKWERFLTNFWKRYWKCLKGTQKRCF